MSMANATRQIGLSEVSFYQWCKEYCGIKSSKVCCRVWCLESVPGHKRKSRTTILMSVMRPKAEVAGEADTKCVVRLPGDWPLIQFPNMSRQPNAKTAR